MEAVLAAVEGSEIARALRVSRWGYATLNAAHILGIAALIGANIPLNLRLLGVWADIPRAHFFRVLSPVAAGGFLLAITAGVLLFSVRARSYAEIAFFQGKLVLVILGAGAALSLHFRYGRRLERAPERPLVSHALFSLVCWIGALVCGRFIAFAG
ncbi:MAG: hypothetical protein ACPGO3_05350 [Magnetospiraceae bacterium]